MERFHDYGITKQLGDKPLRRVYMAYPLTEPERKVVLKVFDAACLNRDYEYETFFERKEFIKQIRHDHLVSIIDMGIEDEQLYVVTPYIAEDSLLHRLKDAVSANWDISDVLHLCIQLGQTLNYVHSCGLVHANIKPENILFDQDGKVMLTDFSLAGLIDEDKLEYKADSHTINYMAPEQGTGQSSEKSDQYALGCIGYELIAGKTPFSTQDISLAQIKHATAISEIIPEIPPRVEQVFMRTLDRDPAERYPSMAAFVEALQAALRVFPSSPSLQVLPETQHALEAYVPESLEHMIDAEEAAEDAVANPYTLDHSLIDALTDEQEFPPVFETGATSGHKPPAFPFGPDKSIGHRKFSHLITDEVPDVSTSSSVKQTSGEENDTADEAVVPGFKEDEEFLPETADTAIVMPPSISTSPPPKQVKTVQDATSSPMQAKEPLKLSLHTPRGTPGKLAKNLFPLERRTGILLLLAVCLSLAGLLTPYLAGVLQANQRAQRPVPTPTPTMIPTPTPTLIPTPTLTPTPTPRPTPKPKPTPRPTPKPKPTLIPTSIPNLVPTPTPTPRPTPKPTPTPTLIPTPTPIPPTPTPIPTVIPTPTPTLIPDLVPTPTLIPTPTPIPPTPTPTMIPTPQPPLITSDMTPQQIYQTATSGPLLYSSSLAAQDAASWNLINFIGGGSCHFANGGYQAEMPQANGLAYCKADAVDVSNVAVQVEMKVTSGSNNDGGGIFLRDGSGGSYRFRISLDGSWDFVPGDFKGNSPAILKGLNQTNVLTIVAQGADLYLFINQQYLTHIISSTYTSGRIGFMAACWNSDTNVIFNNIKVWKLR